MSDALNYLLKVRKDAMGPYFKFLKEGGRHLDDKTRSLLSVITKVEAQTETGFKQYLVRALQAGNQADEILDAMLVCMPILGLSKVIWAVDIIQQMEIPEFDPDLIGKDQEWHQVVALSEVNEGVSRHEFGKRACFVHKKGDEYQVYDSRCPHQVTNIPMLSCEGSTLTCPKHEWKFDVASGDCIEKGSRPLNRFQFKIDNGYLHVYA